MTLRPFAVCLLLVAACGTQDHEVARPIATAPSSTATADAPPTSTSTAIAVDSAAPTSTAIVSTPPPPPECPDGMVKVAGGSFQFGLLKKEVQVGDLCVDKTEVTATAYEACVKDGKCTDAFLDCAEAKTFKIAGKENHPIVCVDYPQANGYCTAVGKRLPTQEEWEWVARAGQEARKYAFGNDAPKDEVCWSGSSTGARKGTCAVGEFPASNNPQGIVDLTGNVFEWTSSKADSAGTMYVTKGGTWRDGVAAQLQITRPGGFKPSYRCGFGGVRCVAEAKSQGAKVTAAAP
ncbi:MAG: SUMF1/EgtB/PvdO family nonheme iron enzyme [Polyangiaceae bacterium]|nr:SUMF1/EgtB/PvdO family nonheme iron enzyme [Polyangiaceae bacterium]